MENQRGTSYKKAFENMDNIVTGHFVNQAFLYKVLVLYNLTYVNQFYL